MKLQIFLSWSGERSKIIAEKLNTWLPKVIQAVRPWMSSEQIMKGERWSESIGKNLEAHNIGILCITPENLKSEWINFEAGALSKVVGKSFVFPLLYGLDFKNFTGPLTQFQASLINKVDLFKLIESINSILSEDKISPLVLKETYQFYWNEIEELLIDLSRTEVKFNPTSLPKILSVVSNYSLPEPLPESSVYLNEGFETHSLYHMITDISQKRLYNLSRLNRKLLDKEHWSFWKSLKEKIDNGFELKLLFLDPEAPEHVLKASHSDSDFGLQVKQAIETAFIVFKKFDLDINVHCRKYKTIRNFALTVVDEAVLFTPIIVSSYGIAEQITKSSFSIVHSSSKFGNELLEDFTYKWNSGNFLSN